MVEAEQYITLAEAAEYLQISTTHLRVLVRYGEIPCRTVSPRVRRFKREELDKWLRQRRPERGE